MFKLYKRNSISGLIGAFIGTIPGQIILYPHFAYSWLVVAFFFGIVIGAYYFE